MDFASRITKGVIATPMRNTIYGVEGIGKSTFATMFPNPITLSSEDGTNHIDTERFKANDWNDAIGLMQFLYSEPHSYKTVNIDTVNWLEEMMAKELCARWNVDGIEKIDKGFGKYKRYMTEEYSNFLNWCAALHGKGMHINFIGHADVKGFNNPEGDDYDRYSTEMIVQKLAKKLHQWSDNVLFFNYDSIIVEGEGFEKTKARSFNRRIIHTQRSAAFDAKNRLKLPPTMEFTDPPETGFSEFWGYYETWCKSATPPIVTNVSEQEIVTD